MSHVIDSVGTTWSVGLDEWQVKEVLRVRDPLELKKSKSEEILEVEVRDDATHTGRSYLARGELGQRVFLTLCMAHHFVLDNRSPSPSTSSARRSGSGLQLQS